MRQLLMVLIAAFGLVNSSFAQNKEEFPLRDFTKCSVENKEAGYTKPCKDELNSTDIKTSRESSEKQPFSFAIQGDTLTVTAKVASGDITFAGKPYLCCDIQAYLDPLGDDLYAAKFRWHDMDQSLLELRLFNVAKPSNGNATYHGSKEFLVPRNDIDQSVLQNAGMALTEHVFKISQEFGARKVTVIKGPACLQNLMACRVIYMADGQSLAFLVKNALLNQRDLSHFVFVGIHIAEAKENTNNIRIDELLFGYHPARYETFMHFSTVTLIHEIEGQDLPLARYSAGYSNGGAWAYDMLLARPDVFAGAIIMSPAEWKPRADTRLTERRVFIGAGHLESGFLANARAMAADLRSRNALVQEIYVPSGHGMNTWTNIWSRSLLALSDAALARRP